jgi:hypothetical protein
MDSLQKIAEIIEKETATATVRRLLETYHYSEELCFAALANKKMKLNTVLLADIAEKTSSEEVLQTLNALNLKNNNLRLKVSILQNEICPPSILEDLAISDDGYISSLALRVIRNRLSLAKK